MWKVTWWARRLRESLPDELYWNCSLTASKLARSTTTSKRTTSNKRLAHAERIRPQKLAEAQSPGQFWAEFLAAAKAPQSVRLQELEPEVVGKQQARSP